MELKELKEALVFDTGNASLNQRLKQGILNDSDCFGRMYELSDPQCRTCTARVIYLGEEHAVRDLCEMQCASRRRHAQEVIEASQQLGAGSAAFRARFTEIPESELKGGMQAAEDAVGAVDEIEESASSSYAGENDGLSMHGSMGSEALAEDVPGKEAVTSEDDFELEDQGEDKAMPRARRQVEDVSKLAATEAPAPPRRRGRPPKSQVVSEISEAPKRRGRPPKLQGAAQPSLRATAPPPKAKPGKSVRPPLAPQEADDSNPYGPGTDSFAVYHVIKQCALTPPEIREAVVEFRPELAGKKVGIYNCLNNLVQRVAGEHGGMLKGHKLIQGKNEEGRPTWFIKVPD